MRDMMQEKPQPSIHHMQATGRAALKLGTKNIAWAARPRTRAQSGKSTATGKLCCQRRNHHHGNPRGVEIGLAQKIILCAAISATAPPWVKKRKGFIMRKTRASRNWVFL